MKMRLTASRLPLEALQPSDEVLRAKDVKSGYRRQPTHTSHLEQMSVLPPKPQHSAGLAVLQLPICCLPPLPSSPVPCGGS